MSSRASSLILPLLSGGYSLYPLAWQIPASPPLQALRLLLSPLRVFKVPNDALHIPCTNSSQQAAVATIKQTGEHHAELEKRQRPRAVFPSLPSWQRLGGRFSRCTALSPRGSRRLETIDSLTANGGPPSCLFHQEVMKAGIGTSLVVGEIIECMCSKGKHEQRTTVRSACGWVRGPG